MKNFAIGAALALGMAAAAAVSVRAATVDVVDLGFANAPLMGNPTATSTSPPTNPTPPPAQGVYENIVGSLSGNYRSVWQSNVTTSPAGGFNPGAATSVDSEATVPYTSVSGGAYAIFSFSRAQRDLSLAWGSPDRFNTLEFYSSASATPLVALASIVGTAIKPLSSHNSNFDGGSSNGLAYVKLSLSGGLTFDSIKFISNLNNAFEFAALKATPVPLPLGVVFALTAVAGFGLMRRRTATA